MSEWTPQREAELAKVREAAAQVYTAEGVDVFLNGRNESLGGVSPLALIAVGEAWQVLDLIEALADGVFL